MVDQENYPLYMIVSVLSSQASFVDEVLIARNNNYV